MDSFKAGKYLQRDHYRSFEPNAINRQWQIRDMKVMSLLSRADRQLGRLDMYSEYVPNIDLFISAHVAKEATKSSKIEGTQTRMEEAFMDEEHISPEKRDDWEEVQNYIKAMNRAITELEHLPVSTRLIRETHRVLMQGVRGERKQPGEFRSSQNWIGGATLDDALFVPPLHQNIPDLMSDLEQFIHNQEIDIPDLIKIAIVHYQFETIHPFLDGNGRVGRLLITLYLVSRNILKKPMLYLSDFLERNRTTYFNNLMRVRERDDMGQWIKFFLAGVIETAESGIATLDGILQLKDEVDRKLQTLGSRAGNAQKVVHRLFQRPVVTADQVGEAADVSKPTAYTLITSLEDLGILDEITGNERNRVYLFREYMELFTSKRDS
ncbi:MAG: Fic family protein [Balneolaceae bacterium]|nr:Fic family protein [Balneolaceae bacterium]